MRERLPPSSVEITAGGTASVRRSSHNPRTNVPENCAKNPCFFAELLRDIDRVFPAEQPVWHVRRRKLNGRMRPNKLGQSDGANRPGDHTMRGNHTVHLC